MKIEKNKESILELNILVVNILLFNKKNILTIYYLKSKNKDSKLYKFREL